MSLSGQLRATLVAVLDEASRQRRRALVVAVVWTFVAESLLAFVAHFDLGSGWLLALPIGGTSFAWGKWRSYLKFRREPRDSRRLRVGGMPRPATVARSRAAGQVLI